MKHAQRGRSLRRGRILANEDLRGGFRLLRLEAPEIARSAAPGQFVLLKACGVEWPYLRRPFSVYATDGEATIEIVYRVVGTATSVMAATLEGEYDLLGPLGNGFTAPPAGLRVIAVAGGAGLPPVAFYCQKYGGLLESVTLVIGARTRQELLVPVGLVAEGVDLRTYTDDGSKGAKGTAIDGLAAALEQGLHAGGAVGTDDAGKGNVGSDAAGGRSALEVVACGPREMLAEAAAVCARADVPCRVCVEEMMGCGIGACQACAVPQRGGGYLHACTDGPVFDAALLDWARWRRAAPDEP